MNAEQKQKSEHDKIKLLLGRIKIEADKRDKTEKQWSIASQLGIVRATLEGALIALLSWNNGMIDDEAIEQIELYYEQIKE